MALNWYWWIDAPLISASKYMHRRRGLFFTIQWQKSNKDQHLEAEGSSMQLERRCTVVSQREMNHLPSQGLWWTLQRWKCWNQDQIIIQSCSSFKQEWMQGSPPWSLLHGRSNKVVNRGPFCLQNLLICKTCQNPDQNTQETSCIILTSFPWITNLWCTKGHLDSAPVVSFCWEPSKLKKSKYLTSLCPSTCQSHLCSKRLVIFWNQKSTSLSLFFGTGE